MTQSSKKTTPETANHTSGEDKTSSQRSAETQNADAPRVTDRRFWAKKNSAGPQSASPSGDEGPEVLESEPTQPDHDPSEPFKARILELEEKLGATLSQYKEALDGFEAAKARIQRDVHLEVAKGRNKMLVPLLEVLDNLDRALDSEGTEGHEKALYKGVDMVRQQFLQRLSEQGIERIEALGHPFDPTHFEAISTMPVDSKEKDGLVMGVVRQAYVMERETIRHGMVAVGKFAG